MTTKQILSAAYADVFGIDVHENGIYYDEKFNGTLTIDYASFDYWHKVEFHDDDFFEAVLEDGSEGVWIRVERVHFRHDKHVYERNNAGTVKSLCEGLAAWRDMGALSGLLVYTANKIAYESRRG